MIYGWMTRELSSHSLKAYLMSLIDRFLNTFFILFTKLRFGRYIHRWMVSLFANSNLTALNYYYHINDNCAHLLHYCLDFPSQFFLVDFISNGPINYILLAIFPFSFLFFSPFNCSRKLWHSSIKVPSLAMKLSIYYDFDMRKFSNYVLVYIWFSSW